MSLQTIAKSSSVNNVALACKIQVCLEEQRVQFMKVENDFSLPRLLVSVFCFINSNYTLNVHLFQYKVDNSMKPFI